MKKEIKALFASAIILTAVLSCTQEESFTTETTNETNLLQRQLNNAEIEVYKNHFINIMNSNEYIEYLNYSKIMAEKIGDENYSNVEDLNFLNSREDFNSWVIFNLSKTKFSTVEEALDLYDKLIYSSNNFENAHGAFYSNFANFDSDDVILILEPELANPPAVETNSDPHANYCMDVCSSSLDTMNENYAGYMQDSPDSFTRMIVTIWYWKRYTAIINELNDCLNYIP